MSVRVLGVMTGTSCDGMDAACMEFSSRSKTDSPRLLWSGRSAYPARLRARVLELQRPGTRHSLRAILELDRDLGAWYGESISRMLARRDPKPDVIANHGQTVAHFPNADRRGTTLQLGNPSQVAVRTGLSVISRFRDGDLAAGGQGAPLVPLFHRLLIERLRGRHGKRALSVSIHNIGGISNLTLVPARGEILAFDTGPGNLWIDAAAARASGGRLSMDRNGSLSRAGIADPKAVARALRHPYFGLRPPKSTGRDDFPSELFLRITKGISGANLVATATAITVESIARAYEGLSGARSTRVDEIYLCGGGSRNPALVRALRERLAPIRVSTVDAWGLDAQLVEAQAFSYFGWLSLRGKPLGGPWTGARAFGPPGEITPGANWGALLKKLRAS